MLRQIQTIPNSCWDGNAFALGSLACFKKLFPIEPTLLHEAIRSAEVAPLPVDRNLRARLGLKSHRKEQSEYDEPKTHKSFAFRKGPPLF
jgi:hypothetical protein